MPEYPTLFYLPVGRLGPPHNFASLPLHCYVVIDLKMGEFEPEYSGKMNFYVEAVNRLLRTEVENPTIGIVLCRSKQRTIVEYALGSLQNPIGVATYQLKEEIPLNLRQNLPTAEQLEVEMEAAIAEIKEDENA